MKKKLIYFLVILSLLISYSCINSQSDTTDKNLPQARNNTNKNLDSLHPLQENNPQFISKLNEKWDDRKNEKDVYSDFFLNMDELKKGNWVYAREHIIAGSKLNEHEAKDVHIIVFSHEDEKLFKRFLTNIDSFINLEAISIGGINLEGELLDKLINQLSKKKHLKKLRLRVCYLKNIPSSINKLKDLETLDISENHLSTLPKEIGGLKNLRHLNLRNNRPLKILPPEIGSLIQLQYLGFEGSKLSKIPNTIGGCKNLIKIVGNACKIEAIPFEIGKCTELRDINLSYNKIDSIPSEIGELNSLKTISLGGNHICKLPNSFEKLSKLRFCGLGHNQFKTFPNPVLRLQKVQTLWLHENEFNEVPIDLANMKSLIYFLVDEPELNPENVEKIKELNPQIRFIDED